MFDWQIPGHEPTANELHWEELEEGRPSRLNSSSGPVGPPRASAATGAPGADTTVTPPFTAPAANSPCLGGGPTPHHRGAVT
jgi:hypothetical protein